MADSHKGYIGIAKESSWGVKVVPPTEFLEVENDSLLISIPEVESPMINNTRAKTKRSQGLRTVGGGVPWEVNTEDFIGHALKSLISKEVFVDDVPNNNGEHTFTIQDALPAGYTLQAGRDLAVFDFFGSQCVQLDVAWVPGEHLKAVSTWTCKDADVGTPNTPSYTLENPLIPHIGTFEIDDVANEFTVANISIVGGIKSTRPILGSNLALAKPQRPGVYTVTGNVMMYFESIVERNKYLAGTATKLEFAVTGSSIGADKRELKFTLPNVFYNGSTEALPSRDEGDIKLDLPFQAFVIGSDELIEVLLRNSRQSAY